MTKKEKESIIREGKAIERSIKDNPYLEIVCSQDKFNKIVQRLKDHGMYNEMKLSGADFLDEYDDE